MTTRNNLPTSICLTLFYCALVSISTFAQGKKILIVSTNRDTVGTNQSGTFLTEIAYPFQFFTSRGFEVDIVTPKGGKASIYSRAKEADALTQIQNSEFFILKTTQTLSPEQVEPRKYSAVFYPGGHGQYFDVVNDERIARITASIYERGGVIGTAGHGAASLINVQLSNGKYLVANKSMTCFPWWAEKKFMNISNYGKLLAFDMQEVLARRGAKLTVSTFETYKSKELNQIVDKENRLVTGAFAGSAQWVAEEMEKLIGKRR
jgi:putative intracellular protease/amidase